MLPFIKVVSAFAVAVLLGSCGSNQGEDTGHRTPIDSTIQHGTAPATYGGDNPANYQDTTLANSTDTGTTAASSSDNNKAPNN